MQGMDAYIVEGITKEDDLRQAYENFEQQKQKSQKYIDKGIGAYLFLKKNKRVFPHVRTTEGLYFQAAFFHAIGGSSHQKDRGPYADLLTILTKGFVFIDGSVSNPMFKANVSLSVNILSTSWWRIVPTSQEEGHKGVTFGVLLKSGPWSRFWGWLSFRSPLPLGNYEFLIKSVPRSDIAPVIFLPTDITIDRRRELVRKYTRDLSSFSEQVEFF